MKLYAPNPILTLDAFVPDVEAHVWEDGRIYLYGSFDIQGRMSYCSDRYHVYSSDDMVNWVDHGVAFTLAQAKWAAESGNKALYAPDCAYRNGTYYLYYCVPDGRCGVAVSDKPYGPFSDIGYIKGVDGIDPAVLIDDDGQAYLYWGQFDNVRVSKLKENMIEIDHDSITQPLSVGEHEFHEGSSVKKIGGKYYYLFTDTHRHGKKATSMGYAVSDHPMKGFKYGGVIIDNFGCDPRSWNNHGSMANFRGQWYIFYHRSTHNCEFSRHVCVEPIEISEDGRIREVKMTTSGIGAPLPANEPLAACRSAELSGRVRIVGNSSSANTLVLGEIRDGDSATYRYLEFNGETSFSIKLCADRPCRVELYIDGWYHDTLNAPASKDYAVACKPIAPIEGVHELTLKFYGNFDSMCVDEFLFADRLDGGGSNA